MRIKKGIRRLNPNEFLGKKLTAEIVDVTADVRKGAKGNYEQYEITVLVGGDIQGDAAIAFLFNRDLNALIEEFGEDTDQWKAKHIDLSAEKDGQYARWKLSPVEMVQ